MKLVSFGGSHLILKSFFANFSPIVLQDAAAYEDKTRKEFEAADANEDNKVSWQGTWNLCVAGSWPLMTTHVDRQCPPLPHLPPQQCRGSAALFSHWITTDQHSIRPKEGDTQASAKEAGNNDNDNDNEYFISVYRIS